MLPTKGTNVSTVSSNFCNAVILCCSVISPLLNNVSISFTLCSLDNLAASVASTAFTPIFLPSALLVTLLASIA